MTMSDPILEEIWKIRAELLQKHGGLDGYFKYVERIDRARQAKSKRQRGRKTPSSRITKKT